MVELSSASTPGEAKAMGFTFNGEVYLRGDTYPMDVIGNYCHEMGHLAGEELSFVGDQVLTPSEARNTSLPDLGEVLLLIVAAQRVKTTLINTEILVNVANRLLRVFTKGNFEPLTVPTHLNIPPDEFDSQLKSLILQSDNPTVGVNADGRLHSRSTKLGRNGELSAMAVEMGCMTILRNSSIIPLPPITKASNSNELSSHQRAWRIATRAYSKNSSLVIPSVLDLRRQRN